MRILEISDRGIKLIEDGETINQGLFNEKEDIPFEIKELLSIYDNPDNITLKILFSLDEDIVLEIKKIVKEAGWKLNEPYKISKKFKYISVLIIVLQLILGGVVFLKSSALEEQVFNLKKENTQYTKLITTFDEKMKLEILDEKVEIDIFQRSDLSEFLVFLSEISRKAEINYQKIQYIDKKIKIEGFGAEMKNISKLKKYISGYKHIDNSKFDFIKKEGEILYFLIELDQE